MEKKSNPVEKRESNQFKKRESNQVKHGEKNQVSHGNHHVTANIDDGASVRYLPAKWAGYLHRGGVIEVMVKLEDHRHRHRFIHRRSID